jgi:hypothetical protein
MISFRQAIDSDVANQEVNKPVEKRPRSPSVPFVGVLQAFVARSAIV